MKNRNEISGARPLENRLVYVSPEIETVGLQAQTIIAVSTGNVGIGNPWTGSEEVW